MAPRAPEPFTDFMKRLKKAIKAGQTQVRFGLHHHDHAVCMEGGVFRLRRLEATEEEMDAYMKEHGMFMPENLEEISKPGTLVAEFPTLEALGKSIRKMFTC